MDPNFEFFAEKSEICPQCTRILSRKFQSLRRYILGHWGLPRSSEKWFFSKNRPKISKPMQTPWSVFAVIYVQPCLRLFLLRFWPPCGLWRFTVVYRKTDVAFGKTSSMAFKRTISEVFWSKTRPYPPIWISPNFAKFGWFWSKIWNFFKKWKFEKISNWPFSTNFCPKCIGNSALESPRPIFFDFGMYKHIWACCGNIRACMCSLVWGYFYGNFAHMAVYSGL